jgi:dTDP-4-amino-4,6-dideoxygalactose transaminase
MGSTATLVAAIVVASWTAACGRAEIFSLPMYPSLTDGDQDRVCEALRTILSGRLAQSSI